MDSPTTLSRFRTPAAPVARAAADALTVEGAKVSADGKSLTISLTYTCTDATHLTAVAGQPPRNSGQKYERVGAGNITPTCDGKSHTAAVKADPQSTFTGTWKASTKATVGASLVKVAVNQVITQLSDSKDMTLSG
ncbi:MULTISPECIES: hypothetical protein [Actinomadura]|uniref:Uncharacterized protein n=1 Tax=Actinomadura yumaensis TaxID=111807 RepID=A0ABW2CFF6_9ACTN|nr:hypothetical protein [Actinomadura sp. J1-007]MWK35627.1 hypothetical protein [Actinomadura sp. J1-007]